MSASIIENAATEQNVAPAHAEKVLENSANYESTTEQEAAIFDPSINKEKTNDVLTGEQGFDVWQNNPYKAVEQPTEESQKYAALYELSKQPLYESLAKKYGTSLAYKTDVVLGHTRQTGYAPYRFYSAIVSNLNSMRVSATTKDMYQARIEGDMEKAARLEEQLTQQKHRLEVGPQPFEDEGWNTAAAFVASTIRNPEILALSAIGTAAAVMAAPAVAVGAGIGTTVASSALIYNDTYKLSMGELLPQLQQENPALTDAEAYELAKPAAESMAAMEVFFTAIGATVTGGQMLASSRAAARLALKAGIKKSGTQAIRDMPEFLRTYLKTQMPRTTGQLAGEYAKEVGGNITEEFMQQVMEEAALNQAKTGESFTTAFANRLTDFLSDPTAPRNAELLATIKNTAFGAGIVSGAMAAPGMVRNQFKNKQPTLLQRSKEATNNLSFAQQLFDWRQKNPVAKQSPEVDEAHSQTLVAQGIAPKTVRIDRQVAEEILAAPEFKEAAKELQLQAAVEESEENGGTIDVDFVQYDKTVNSNKELFQKVRGAVAFTENSMSVNEFISHLDSLDSESLSEITKARETVDSVYNQVYEQQMQMGNIEEKLARANAITAQLISNRIGAFRVGQTRTGEQAFGNVELRAMTEEEALSGLQQKTLDNAQQPVNIKAQGVRNEQEITSGTEATEPAGIVGRIRQNIREGNDGNVWVDTGTSGKTARGSKGKRVLSFTPEASQELSKENYSTTNYTVYDNPAQGAKEFLAAMQEAVAELGEYAASVDVKELKDYKDMKALILSEDKKTGCAVTKDGDIVSLFSSSPERGRAVPMLLLAVKNGGKKLDCFDIYLPKLYAKAGFKAVARNHWNEEYKPDGWNKELFDGYNHGEPDVVFMVYDASGQQQQYNVGDGVLIEGEDAYDKGMAAQDEALAEEGNISNYTLFQSAYAGTKEDYDKPSLEAIGSGEGNQAHGWGLYYALDPLIADFYRQKFTSDYRYRVDYNGKEINRDYETSGNAIENILWDMHVAMDNISGMSETEKARKAKEKLTKNLKESITYEEDRLKTEQNERLIKYLETDLKRNKEKLEALNNIDPDLIKEHKWGQVHEVDVPEMDVLLDEQQMLIDQPQYVQDVIQKINKDLDLGIVDSGIRGGAIYDKISDKLGSDKAASKLLDKEGIKGITYEGREDGRCFVIFNDKNVKVLRKKFDELGNQLFQKDEEHIAGVFKVENGKLVIGLTAYANPTTLSHELFHWFSREMQDAFNSGEMTEYWAKQVKNLARMVGAKIENGKLTLTEAQEEHAANLFLTYIKEGKVENREIAPLFAYMQDLFRKACAYLKITGKLSKQADALFDSIFRAQDVIEHEQRMAGLIPVAKPDGADQELYDMYVGEMLASRMKATHDLIRKREAAKKYAKSPKYEAIRERTKDEVIKELSEKTEYQIKALAAEHDNNALETFMAISSNPELAALDLPVEQIEYILNNVPNIAEAAEKETERRMLEHVQEEFRLQPEQLGLDESRNTAKVKALLAESLMLSGKTAKDFDEEYKKVSAAADRQVAKTEIRRLKKSDYWDGLEANLVERYVLALGLKDKAAMAKHRRDQAIVNAIRMRAEAISKRYDRFVSVAETFEGAQQKVVHKQNGKSVAEYKYTAEAYDLLQSILEQFGFYIKYARRSKKPVAEKMVNWIADQEETTLTKLGELKNYTDFIVAGHSGDTDLMTGAEFDKLSTVFDGIKGVAGGEFAIMLKSEKIFLSDMVAATREHFDALGIEGQQKSDNFFVKEFGAFGKWTNPEPILRAIFPEKVVDAVWLPFIDAAVKAERIGRQWVDRYRAAKAKVDISSKQKQYNNGKVLSNHQVADLLLSMGNEHAYENFRLAFGLTEEQSEQIVSEALKDQPQLAEFVKEVWATYKLARDQLEPEFEQRTNTLFIRKEYRSFEINGTQFGGGYVPERKALDTLRTDPRAANSIDMIHDKKFEKNVVAEADGNVLSIVDITENELFQSAKQGYTANEYNNVVKFLKQDGLHDTIGDRAYSFITDWIQAYQIPVFDTSGWARPLASLSTLSALGFRATTMILQLSGLFQSAASLGKRYFARGLMMALRNGEWAPVLATRKGADKSDYMAARIGDPRSSLLGLSILESVRSQSAKTGAGKALQYVTGKAGQYAMWGIQYFDTIVANITWNGAYLKALDQGKSEAEARRTADSEVRVVQSDSLQISRSAAMQSQMARMFTAFATWIMAMQSQLRAKLGTKQYKDAGVWALTYMIASPAFEALLKEGWASMTGIGDDDDDKDFVEKVMNTWYNQIIDTVGTSGIPVASLGAYFTKGIAAGIELGITDENDIFKVYQANVPALQVAGRSVNAVKNGIAAALSGDEDLRDKALINAASVVSSEGGKIVKMLLSGD